MTRSLFTTALCLALVLPLLGTAPPAAAMQNIKCIKNEVGALASRWAQQAGEARAALGADGASGHKRAPIDALLREGRRLAGACRSCGATRESERVQALAGQLQAAATGKPGEESARALNDALAQIEALPAEFGL